MNKFLQALKVQRDDDHRYYHHSRINQTLHLVSAISFLIAYVALFFDPAIAALVGWLVAMTTRQLGHFFFEPKDYDVVNQATHEYKESIKVGYNLHRKIILLSVWALSPAILWIDPMLFAVDSMSTPTAGLIHQIGMIWTIVGLGGLLFRTVHLFLLKDLQTGVVWMTKILTDPFHDIKLYYRSPIYLLRGQLIDPMSDSTSA